MFRSFFDNKTCRVWAWGGAVFLVSILYLQVDIQVFLNKWHGDFYDMMQKVDEHEVKDFWMMMLKFIKIVVVIMFINTVSSYATQLYVFKWREEMTMEYARYWRGASSEVEGSSQRIQEDCYRFARIMESLGIRFIRAIFMFIGFMPVLWELGKGVKLPIVGDIPGSLMWFALIITIGGFVITWLVGWFLPTLEYNNQKVEAAFRKELVFGEDDKVHHADPETLIELFTGIKLNYHRLFRHYAYFGLWTSFFNNWVSVVPFLAMGPSVLAGAVTLGVMMQVNNAFWKVQSSFGVVMDSWMTITELRSIWRRLHEFEKNINYKEQRKADKLAGKI